MSNQIKDVSWPEWETVRMIGQGSSGVVYEIQKDILVDVQKAALKVISIPQTDSDIEEMYGDGQDKESITSTFQTYLKSVVAEYSLMRKMNGCAHIVSCDDVRYVQHDDGIGWDIFIKMELLTPLMKALPAQIPEQTVIKVAEHICEALVQCRKYGVVHRDIKPQNIFVSDDGKYKLGDFGIAKPMENTMGGTKIGTYKYMAPEVFNNQPYGSTADIYSLGLVLYWMLNERRLPFLPLPPAKLGAGLEEEARKRRVSGEKFPAPKNGRQALKTIVMKACAYDPRARYQSAADMLEDLRRLSGGVPLAPSSDTSTVPVDDDGAEDTYTMTMSLFGKTRDQSEKGVWMQGGDLAGGDGSRDLGQGTVGLDSREKPGKTRKAKKKHGLAVVLGIVGALALILAGLQIFWWFGEGSADGDPASEGQSVVTVEDVIGKDVQKAAQALRAQGLKVEVVEVYDATVEEGLVIDQDPAPGTKLQPEENVSITVSLGESREVDIVVSFDANGGKVQTQSAIYAYGDAYGVLPTPTRAGYTFDGWYTKESGGSKIWRKTEILSTSEDHTLYAHWTVDTYTVTLDPNGGKISPSSVSVEYGANYGVLPTPTQKGYTFDGWYTKANGGTKIWRATGVSATADHTLYAHWTVNTYTVTLDPNGGKLSTSTVSLVYGSPYGALPVPTREGYTFDGWYTEASGGTKVWRATNVSVAADHTLYAHWVAN